MEFYYLLFIFLIAQGQVILFCYYGEMIQNEVGKIENIYLFQCCYCFLNIELGASNQERNI